MSPHGQGQRIQAVLNAKEQERVGAVAIDGAGLEFAEAAELQDGVSGIDTDGEECDGEAGEQTDCGRSGMQGCRRLILAFWRR